MSMSVGLIGLVALAGLVALIALVLYWVFNSRRSGRVGVAGLLLVLLMMGGLAALLLPATMIARGSRSTNSTGVARSPQSIDDAVVEAVFQIRKSFRQKMPDEGPPELIVLMQAPDSWLSRETLRRVRRALVDRGMTAEFRFERDINADEDGGLPFPRYEIELDFRGKRSRGTLMARADGHFANERVKDLRIADIPFQARGASAVVGSSTESETAVAPRPSPSADAPKNRLMNHRKILGQGAAALVCALMLGLAYLFLDAQTRGHYTWPLRIGVAIVFVAACSVVWYMRAAV